MVIISNRMVTEITMEQENYFLTTVHMPNENEEAEGIIRVIVSPQTVILDREGLPLSASMLCEGMMMDAVISDAMTLSLPPQTTAYEIQVK